MPVGLAEEARRCGRLCPTPPWLTGPLAARIAQRWVSGAGPAPYARRAPRRGGAYRIRSRTGRQRSSYRVPDHATPATLSPEQRPAPGSRAQPRAGRTAPAAPRHDRAPHPPRAASRSTLPRCIPQRQTLAAARHLTALIVDDSDRGATPTQRPTGQPALPCLQPVARTSRTSPSNAAARTAKP